EHHDGDRGHAEREREQAGRDERRRAAVGVIHVHAHDDAQVVEGREHRVQREDHGQPRVPRVEHGPDDEELRDEADRRRDTGQRDQEHREHEGAEPVTAREAVHLVERRAARALEVEVEEGRERAEVHEAVSEHVEQDGRARGGPGLRRRDRREDVAGVRDARVREHPLRIRLNERHDVARGHRDRGKYRVHGRPIDDERAHTADEHAQDRGERGRLRTDRHERGRGRRRAVVRVRRPLVERDDRGLEAEADGDEREGDDRRSARESGGSEGGGDVHESRRARDAEKPGEAVHEQRRAERAEQEVLERGLVRVAIAPLHPGEDVDRDGHELEAHEERDEIRRERDGHRAERREEERRVVLAGRDVLALEVRRRDDRGEQREHDEHRPEEVRERIDVHEPAEERRRSFPHEDLDARPERRPDRRREERDDEAGGDEHRQQPAGSAPRQRRVRDDHEARRERHDDLGRDGDEVGPGHLSATCSVGSRASLTMRSRLGSMIAMAGCGNTPSATVRMRSGTAHATSIGDRSWSALYASRTGPYITRWNIQSRYTAARMTPSAASGPQKRPPSGSPPNWNVPSSTRNSLTKPLRPGSPSDASTKTPKNAVYSGHRCASPPRSAMTRRWVRSYWMPTKRKSAPVTNPWFSIWRTAPTAPCVLSTKIPSVMNPMCATDEYATSFFRSFWTVETAPPYRIATTERTMITGSQIAVPTGNSGSAKRRNP